MRLLLTLTVAALLTVGLNYFLELDLDAGERLILMVAVATLYVANDAVESAEKTHKGQRRGR